MILHSSNLQPLKRIDLLLETVALIRPRESFKLVILAGGDFSPFAELLTVLSRPYEDQADYADYANPPNADERVLRTFCGT